ncbi:uncharacterized protein LOC115209857 isoform X1 [Argonauta hians]
MFYVYLHFPLCFPLLYLGALSTPTFITFQNIIMLLEILGLIDSKTLCTQWCETFIVIEKSKSHHYILVLQDRFGTITSVQIQKSADEKLKSLSKSPVSRTTNQAKDEPLTERHERSGRRLYVSTDNQSKARHRSRSEGPRRNQSPSRQDTAGPQWAICHEPRRSPRPLCLRKLSDDEIISINPCDSDSDSADSGPKQWTRNPLLIKKKKRHDKTKATEWKLFTPPPENKSQTMPTSVNRPQSDNPSPSSVHKKDHQNTWSNPNKVNAGIPQKAKFQRLEERRQQRIEHYPTSDEEANPNTEISNQIRQRLSQVQASRGKGRKASIGEYEGVDTKSSQEYTNYLNISGDQIVLEPKLKTEVSKPPQMTASFPCYRPMSLGFNASGSLSPPLAFKRDNKPPSQPEKSAKPRMVVVEYPRKNNQNTGFLNNLKNENKVEINPQMTNTNIQCEYNNSATNNPNRNSTAFTFENNINCMSSPPPPPPLQQQQIFQPPENFLDQRTSFETNGSLQNSSFLISNGHSPQPNTRPLSFQPYIPPQSISPQTPSKVEQHNFQEQKKEKPKSEQKQRHRRSRVGIESQIKDSKVKTSTDASKCYSDGDSLDELLESNRDYIETGSVNNTLQLAQQSKSQLDRPTSEFQQASLPKVSEPIPMIQPVMPKIPELVTTSKPVLLKMSSEPLLISKQSNGSKQSMKPVTPRYQPSVTTSQVKADDKKPIHHPIPIRITEPVLITQSPVCESSAFQSCMSWLKSHNSAQPVATNQTYVDYQAPKPFESNGNISQYKPLITISESILVSESNKMRNSPEVIKKSMCHAVPPVTTNPTKMSLNNQNEALENELCLPMKDIGMFSDVEYDIEVAERVKKWENKMKTSHKISPGDNKTTEITDVGENHLPTTVKHMANEWSKYLSVIDEDSVATKPYSSDTNIKQVDQPSNVNMYMNKNNMTKSLSQTGSISDGDLFKGKTHSKIMVDMNKSLLHVSPDGNIQTTNGLSQSYHEGINKSPSIDSPFFIPVNVSSNNAKETYMPASSPLTNKDYQFFIPKPHTAASAPNSGSTTLEMRPNDIKTKLYTQDINNSNIPTGHFVRRKSDITSNYSMSDMIPNNNYGRNPEQGDWKNLIGGIKEKLKDSEIWSPQLDSHQGPVSIERVTARTLETIPFSEDPFWKEIEELTNFDHLIKDVSSERKNSIEINSNKSFVFAQMDPTSAQPMKTYSVSSTPASTTDNKAQTKQYSTSSLKSSNKTANMNALDEVLLDLQPVLGTRMSNSQKKIFGSHVDMSHKSSSPKRPQSYHSGAYHGDQLEIHTAQMLKAACNNGPSAERPEYSSQQNLLQLQEGNHGNIMYQSMTKLGEKQYENVVNGNYQLDPSVLKEKLINTGLVERSPSGEDLAFLIKNIQSGNSNIMFAFRDNEKPTTYPIPQPEENIEELKVLASQVEDKLSEIKSKILKADESNLDKILNTLKKFSPSTSAMLSADVKSSGNKKSGMEGIVNRKAKLSEALTELDKIYSQLNIGNETLLDCNKSSNFSSPFSSQEGHCFKLSSSFSQLYDNSTGHVSSDSFHSDRRFLSASDHNLTPSQRYRELMQVPVKDIGSKYPIKTESQTSNSPSVIESPIPKVEDISGDSVMSTPDVPTRRARSRRQRRAVTNEMNQENKKFQGRNVKEGNEGPSVILSSITVEKGPRSKSSARSDTSDGSSRLNNGIHRPKPPPRSSSLHRKAGCEEERNHRKSTPPDFDFKQTTSGSQSQSSNGFKDIQENGNISKKNFQQHQRQEQSCSSDSSSETVQQKKRPVSKGIAKMLDLFSSSDEDRHRKARTRSRHERRPISEITEEQGNKFSDDSYSPKSSPKSQSSVKMMTPRSVKQRHEAKARQKIVIAQQMMAQENDSHQQSDDNLATEDSSTASKPPLPMPRQRSQSSDKCPSSSEDSDRDEQSKETPNESSNNEKQREKSSPASSNRSRSRWSISSAREFVNATDSSISLEQVTENEIPDHAERCNSFHELFASFEPDQKRIEKLKQLQKSASEEAAEEGTNKLQSFHSEPDLRDNTNKVNKKIE